MSEEKFRLSGDDLDDQRRLEKANFDLKMKVYYLEEKIRQFNLNGISDKLTDMTNLQSISSELKAKEMEIEAKNQLLIKAKSAIEHLKSELEICRRSEGFKVTDFEFKLQGLKSGSEVMEEMFSKQVADYELQLSSIRSELNEKSQHIFTLENNLMQYDLAYQTLYEKYTETNDNEILLLESTKSSNETIVKLQEEIHRLNLALGSSAEQISSLAARYEKDLATIHEQHNTNLLRQREELESQHSSNLLQQRADVDRIIQLDDQKVQDLTVFLENEKIRNQDLLRELEEQRLLNNQANSKLVSYSEQISDLVLELQQMESLEINYEVEQAKVDKLTKQLEEERMKNLSMSQLIKELRDECNNSPSLLLQPVPSTTNNIDSHSSKIEELNSFISRLKLELSEQKNANNKLLLNIKSLDSTIARYNSAGLASDSLLEEQEKIITSYQHSLAEVTESNEIYKIKHDSFSKELAQKDSLIQQFSLLLESQEDELKRLKSVSETRLEKIDELQNHLTSAIESKSRLQSVNEHFVTMIEYWKQYLDETICNNRKAKPVTKGLSNLNLIPRNLMSSIESITMHVSSLKNIREVVSDVSKAMLNNIAKSERSFVKDTTDINNRIHKANKQIVMLRNALNIQFRRYKDLQSAYRELELKYEKLPMNIEIQSQGSPRGFLPYTSSPNSNSKRNDKKSVDENEADSLTASEHLGMLVTQAHSLVNKTSALLVQYESLLLLPMNLSSNESKTPSQALLVIKGEFQNDLSLLPRRNNELANTIKQFVVYYQTSQGQYIPSSLSRLMDKKSSRPLSESSSGQLVVQSPYSDIEHQSLSLQNITIHRNSAQLENSVTEELPRKHEYSTPTKTLSEIRLQEISSCKSIGDKPNDNSINLLTSSAEKANSVKSHEIFTPNTGSQRFSKITSNLIELGRKLDALDSYKYE